MFRHKPMSPVVLTLQIIPVLSTISHAPCLLPSRKICQAQYTLRKLKPLSCPTHQILPFLSFFLLFHPQPCQKPMYFDLGCGVLILVVCFGLLRKNSNTVISYAAFCMCENESQNGLEPDSLIDEAIPDLGDFRMRSHADLQIEIKIRPYSADRH